MDLFAPARPTRLVSIRSATAEAAVDAIFVHGLDGDAIGTWRFGEQPSWHMWIGAGVATANVWSLDYRVRSSLWTGGSIPLWDRAHNVLATLDTQLPARLPIVFVCHSYGGLLVKQMLRCGDDPEHEFAPLCARVAGIVFFATPHEGSRIADYASHLAIALRSSKAVRELARNETLLRELTQWFRKYATRRKLALRVYFETQRTSGVQVVDQSSADPGIAGVTPIAVDADHRTICKPETDDFRVRQTVFMIRNAVLASPPSTSSMIGVLRHLDPTSADRSPDPQADVEDQQLGHEHFYNKILCCDVKGYAERTFLERKSCQLLLNEAIRSGLQSLELRIERDVIALPTGGGIILNFTTSSPDIHLRMALRLLESLHAGNAKSRLLSPIRVGIGLNSSVALMARDINGHSNIIGEGVALAQRIAELASPGQIILHGRVGADLEEYGEHAGHIVSVGTSVIRPGLEVPLSQYVDASAPYLSSDLLPRRSPAAARMSLGSILAEKSSDNILTVDVRRADLTQSGTIREYVEEFVETNNWQKLMFVAGWISLELLDNAFEHGNLRSDDPVELRLARTRAGLLVSVRQPDRLDPDHPRSIVQRHDQRFLSIVRDRGLHVHEHRADGTIEVGVELAKDVDLTLHRPQPDFGIDIIAPAEPPAADARSLRTAHENVVVIQWDGNPEIRETNWASFSEWLLENVGKAASLKSNAVLDLSGISYMSSRGLRALSMARKEAGSLGISIALCGANPRMREILAIARHDKIFPVLDTIIDAKQALAGKK